MTSAPERWRHPGWEALAAGLNVLYTFLYIQGKPVAFAAAFAGALLYARICRSRRLLAESALWLFYALVAVVGAVHWYRQGWGSTPAPPAEWQDIYHLPLLAVCSVLWWFTAKYLRTRTLALSPVLDAFTTTFSIPATLLMMAWIPSQWYYWLVINAVSVGLYLRHRLWAGAAMYLLYWGLGAWGLWRYLAGS